MVKEGFAVLPPVYFELSIAIETPLLVHEIDCAAGATNAAGTSTSGVSSLTFEGRYDLVL
jgi:hypothetical protein